MLETAKEGTKAATKLMEIVQKFLGPYWTKNRPTQMLMQMKRSCRLSVRIPIWILFMQMANLMQN